MEEKIMKCEAHSLWSRENVKYEKNEIPDCSNYATIGIDCYSNKINEQVMY